MDKKLAAASHATQKSCDSSAHYWVYSMKQFENLFSQMYVGVWVCDFEANVICDIRLDIVNTEDNKPNTHHHWHNLSYISYILVSAGETVAFTKHGWWLISLLTCDMNPCCPSLVTCDTMNAFDFTACLWSFKWSDTCLYCCLMSSDLLWSASSLAGKHSIFFQISS